MYKYPVCTAPTKELPATGEIHSINAECPECYRDKTGGGSNENSA